ncbi:MAG TPA: hypothetical protein VHL80_07870 [Polyangia bacterium]|nr:hypothetical protein [Polyangia bacterium]
MGTSSDVDRITRAPRAIRVIRCAGAIVAVVGCAPAFPSIAVRTPAGPIAADPEKVTVVIVQPESRLRAVSIVDGRGQLVAQLDGRSHTVIHVPEGPTLLYAVAENRAETADRIEGTLIAGRVYYATVAERPGGGVALLALNARSPDGRWRHKAEYLAATPRMTMNPDLVVREANELGDTAALMRAADAHVATLDAGQAAEHTIQESDGF